MKNCTQVNDYELKLELVKKYSTFEEARNAYNFIQSDYNKRVDSTLEFDGCCKPKKITQLKDGVYIVLNGSKIINYRYADFEKDDVTRALKQTVRGILLVMGDTRFEIPKKSENCKYPLLKEDVCVTDFSRLKNPLNALNNNDGLLNYYVFHEKFNSNIQKPFYNGDEYIPSMKEMVLIALNFYAINNALKKVDGDLLKMDSYWTSTQYDGFNFWNLNFDDLSISSSNARTYKAYVRFLIRPKDIYHFLS